MSVFASLFRILGALSPVHIWWVTATSGAKKIGHDEFGNVYFEAKARAGYTRPRRWVLYKHEAEASAIPPEWHGWMHFQMQDPPNTQTKSFRRAWQKPHIPNKTGTDQAYKPPGHLLNGGQRDKATGDYEAWSPPH
jgi:NADH:ubiquinone oxidoreductase subunit